MLGNAGQSNLRAASVCVIGLGGVGSWAVEALARSGVGALTLMDLDEVCISNTNRQLHSLSDTVGRSKAAVLAERVARINPECAVRVREEWLTVDGALRPCDAPDPGAARDLASALGLDLPRLPKVDFQRLQPLLESQQLLIEENKRLRLQVERLLPAPGEVRLRFPQREQNDAYTPSQPDPESLPPLLRLKFAALRLGLPLRLLPLCLPLQRRSLLRLLR